MKKSSDIFTLLIGIFLMLLGYSLSVGGKIESVKYGTLNYGEENFVVGVMFVILGIYMFTLSAINIYLKIKNKWRAQQNT